jgi:hypothetical protein
MTHPDLPTLVRARLVEAAETWRRLHVRGTRPAQPRTLMPEPDPPSWAEMNGWGTKRLDELRAEFWERFRARAGALEITRAEEAAGWVIAYVANDGRRRALWAWSRMQAGGLPMRFWCRREGIEEHTGKRRADRAVADIARGLAASRNDLALLRDEGGEGVFNEWPISGIGSGMLACSDDAGVAGQFWRPADAVPVHSDDPHVADWRQRDIAEHNARMRRRQERMVRLEREAA